MLTEAERKFNASYTAIRKAFVQEGKSKNAIKAWIRQNGLRTIERAMIEISIGKVKRRLSNQSQYEVLLMKDIHDDEEDKEK